MKYKYKAEIGLNYSKPNNPISFLNAYNNFVPLEENPDPNLLVSIEHDEFGNVSTITLFDINNLSELARITEARYQSISKEVSNKSLANFTEEFKNGTLLNLFEFLVSLWHSFMPMALEKIA